MGVQTSNSRGSVPDGFHEVFHWNLSELSERVTKMQIMVSAGFFILLGVYIPVAAFFGRMGMSNGVVAIEAVLKAPMELGTDIVTRLGWMPVGALERFLFQVLIDVVLVLAFIYGLQAATIILHEGIHGLVMIFFGARPIFGFIRKTMLFYATSPGFAYTRDQHLWIGVTPLLVLNLAFCFALFWPISPMGALILSVLGAFNTAGSIGDLWIGSVLWKFPSHARVIDEKDGFRVFLPAEDSAQAG